MRASTRVTKAAWIAGLVIGTVGIWQLHVVGSAEFPGQFAAGDLFAYFLPAFSYEADALRTGRLPAWNPYQGGGVPFLAVLQPGALYPPRLLLLLGTPEQVMGWSALGHLLALVLATYALCRDLGCRPACAAGGAAAFGGTFGLPAIYNVTVLEPASWLPIGGLALVRVVRTRRLAWVFVLGAAAAMPVLAGGYQYAIYVAYGHAALAIGLISQPGAFVGHRIAGVGRLAVAAMLALAAAAPQWLPTLAWSRQSVRQASALAEARIQPLASEATRRHQIEGAFAGAMPMQLGFPAEPRLRIRSFSIC